MNKLFISHKHADKELGKALADFVSQVTGKHVSVYLSSHENYEGPEGGEDLVESLKKAISDAGVAVLLYTGLSEKVDWAFCIYESTIAQAQGVRLLVFQFGEQAPAPFLPKVRYRVENPTDIARFTRDLMTSKDFFPGQAEPLTGFPASDPYVADCAEKLRKSLWAAYTSHIENEPSPWTGWPFMRVRVPGEDAKKLRAIEAGTERRKLMLDALQNRAIVVDSKAVDHLFGMGVDDNQQYWTLVERWCDTYGDEDLGWTDSIVDQMTAHARKGFAPLKEARIREAMGRASFVPVVSQTWFYSDNRAMDFDIRFFDIRAPSPPVSERMVPIDEMHIHKLDDDNGSHSLLSDTFTELKKLDKARLPIIDSGGRLKYMIHRSTIGEFLTEAMLENKDAKNMTLGDLFGDPTLRSMFTTTFVFVSRDATIEKAREAMLGQAGARDVFVTETGDADQPLLGMLANTDLEAT